MGFFDSLKSAASKAAESVEKGVKSASDSAKVMQEKSRIKRELSQLTTEINQVYERAGRKFLEENPENEAYAEFIAEIKEKTEKTESLNLQLASLEDKVTCTSCGASNDKSAEFCSKCGAKIERPVVVEAEPAGDVCANCGAELAEGASFCEKCGTAVEKAAEAADDTTAE